MKIETLRRELDNTAYAFRCTVCGGVWKVYQQATHYKGCDPEGGDNERFSRDAKEE